MTTIGKTILAAAVVLAVFAGGCGDDEKCNQQTPPVSQVPNCTVPAGAAVSVPLKLCPECDQTSPTCTVDLTNVGSGNIELVPLAELCAANPNCPVIGDPATSCPITPPIVNCSFRAPGDVGGTYNIVVVGPSGEQLPIKTLTIGPADSTQFCDLT